MGFREIDPSQFDEAPKGGFREIDPSEIDQDKPAGDWVDQVNNWSQDALNTIKPFASGAARGVGSLLSLVDYTPATIGQTLASRVTGEETTGDMVNSQIREIVGGPDKDHPYASAAGEIFPSLAIPGGGLLGRAASAAGASAGLGYARDKELGPMAELAATMAGGLAPSAAKGLASLAAPSLEKAGLEMLRKSTGARASDYAKSAKNLSTWDVADGEIESFTKKALDDLLTNGKLGASANPEKALAATVQEESALQKAVGGAIDNYERTVGAPVFPTFERARKYLADLKVPAQQLKAYRNELDALETALLDDGQGSLRALQNQKVAWRGLYEEGNDARNGFNRAVYNDMRDTIEKAVPEVRPLNRELMKYEVVKPILQRALGTSENQSPLSSIAGALRTTGGFLTSPTIIGGTLGGAAGGGVGLAAGAALGKALTPGGQRALGLRAVGAARSLREPIGMSSLFSSAPTLAEQARPQNENHRLRTVGANTKSQTDPLRAMQGESVQKASPSGASPKVRYFDNSTPKAGKNEAKTDVSMPIPKDINPQALETLLDAVSHVESRGNPKALSKVGAKGQFQIMDATGREYHDKLGITEAYDPYNPKQARQIAKAILLDYLRMFDGDVEKAITAYHSGPGNVSKGKIGPEGRKYFPLIQAAFDRLYKV